MIDGLVKTSPPSHPSAISLLSLKTLLPLLSEVASSMAISHRFLIPIRSGYLNFFTSNQYLCLEDDEVTVVTTARFISPSANNREDDSQD